MKNMEIRQEIVQKRLRSYEVAAQMHISASSFCRWLQTDLTPERKERVRIAIDELYRKNLGVHIE